MKGVGFGICVIASYVAMYYNTIISWALYFLFSSFQRTVPWATCDHEWNTENCTIVDFTVNDHIETIHDNFTTSPAAEFFERGVLEINKSSGLGDLGNVKWSI